MGSEPRHPMRRFSEDFGVHEFESVGASTMWRILCHTHYMVHSI
jgi:hypothetical protein